MFKSDRNPGSITLTRDNGNGTVTERTYQDTSDKKLAERSQFSDAPPSIQYQERTIEKP